MVLQATCHAILPKCTAQAHGAASAAAQCLAAQTTDRKMQPPRSTSQQNISPARPCNAQARPSGALFTCTRSGAADAKERTGEAKGEGVGALVEVDIHQQGQGQQQAEQAEGQPGPGTVVSAALPPCGLHAQGSKVVCGCVMAACAVSWTLQGALGTSVEQEDWGNAISGAGDDQLDGIPNRLGTLICCRAMLERCCQILQSYESPMQVVDISAQPGVQQVQTAG